MIGPSFRDKIEFDCEIKLRGQEAANLLIHAERLGRKPVDLLAAIIERVLLDDLVKAVLDE